MCLISFEGQAPQKPPNEGSLKATWSMEELLGWPCVSATVPSQRKYRHSEIKKGTKGTGLAPFYDLLLLFFFFFWLQLVLHDSTSRFWVAILFSLNHGAVKSSRITGPLFGAL